MKCEDARAALTAYLDGELEGDRGSAVRGHLRGCEACRQVAGDEAMLRDALRALPPVDPPASLWAGVQHRLAAAEVADAERPAWRRALARWTPLAPRFGLAGLALTAAALLLVWRAKRHGEDVVAPSPSPSQSSQSAVASAQPPTPPAPPRAGELDVTADLAAAPARATGDYGAAVAELLDVAKDARAQWPDDRKQAFDAKLVELRKQIDGAAEGRPRQKAYRALIRYLQGAAIRDDVALAEIRGVP